MKPSQEVIVDLVGTNADEEKDTPPKKKLKQARLPFQIIASPVTVTQVTSPCVNSSKKRRLSHDTDDIQVVKVVKSDNSVIEYGSASLTECKENLCKDSVGKNDTCVQGVVVVDEVLSSSTANKTNSENEPMENSATVPTREQVCKPSSVTEQSVPVVVVMKLVENESDGVSAAEAKHVLEKIGGSNGDLSVSKEADQVEPVEVFDSDKCTETANPEADIDDREFSEEQLKTPNLKLRSLDESGEGKKLTPRQLLKAAEREKLREEKQKLKQEKDDLKKKEREQKEEQRKKEREQKEDQRKKEREEKEDQKRKEKEDRDRKKQAELDLKNEEKRAKDEEKRKKDQADEEAKNKISKKFTSFFVAKKSDSKVIEEVAPKVIECQNFMPFQVKNDMRLAPIVRIDFTNKSSMDAVMKKQASPALYLEQLKGRVITTNGKTWPLSEYKNEVVIIEADKSTEPTNDNMLLVAETGTAPALRAKLLQFHENRRPPYWGTWRKTSSHIRPTLPFGKDEKLFDYEVDSDDEWEEEEPGESLHGSDDEKESVDDYEIDNDFFVPHGYLSDEENEGEEQEVMSPETQKAKLKVLEIEFEEEMKNKVERIKPRLLGCFWANKHHEIAGTQLMKLLTSRQAVCLDSPTPIVLAAATAPSSPTGKLDESVGRSPGPGAHSTKKVKLPAEAVPSLLRLIHGNSNSRAFLVKEFSAYWSSQGGSHGKELAHGEVLSSRGINNKITELANWMPCLDEGPLLGRMCWYVSQEVRAAHGLADLSTPNTWKYNLQPRRNRESVTEVAGCAGSPVMTTPKLVPLITNFTKTVTPEERQKQFQQTANGHILPPVLTLPGPKLSLITKFTKVLSQEERESQIRSNTEDTLSFPAVSNNSSPAIKPSQSSVPRKRASILVSVPRGQEIPKNCNNLMDRFLTTSAEPSPANHSKEQTPQNPDNKCIKKAESKCEKMDAECIVLSD